MIFPLFLCVSAALREILQTWMKRMKKKKCLARRRGGKKAVFGFRPIYRKHDFPCARRKGLIVFKLFRIKRLSQTKKSGYGAQLAHFSDSPENPRTPPYIIISIIQMHLMSRPEGEIIEKTPFPLF